MTYHVVCTLTGHVWADLGDEIIQYGRRTIHRAESLSLSPYDSHCLS